MTNKLHQAERSLALLAAGGVANRVMATTDGTTMAMQPATSGMLGAGASVRGATKIVAASNASLTMIAQADYVCDGTADQVEINAALSALNSTIGGTVMLSEGTFTLAGSVSLIGARQTLQGQGMDATRLVVVNSGGAPVNGPILTVTSDYSALLDMTIDGNKANNAGATAMNVVTMGPGLGSAFGQTVQRVRIINSAGRGLLVQSYCRNGVVRDCLIETSAGQGALLRSYVDQPLVVSDCVFNGNTGTGAVCDTSPVVLSNCTAVNNSAYGFWAGTASITYINCYAQGNANYGFYLGSGASRSLVAGCFANGNTDAGFAIDGDQCVLVGCFAWANTAGLNRGFRDAGTDTLLMGCEASDQYEGFYHALTGRASFIGCQGIACNCGFAIMDGSVQICDSYSTMSSYPISISGGIYHQIDGNRLDRAQGYGISTNATPSDLQITNNVVTDSSEATNNTYWHILSDGDRTFLHGNMVRDAASGNRPYGGIATSGGSSNSVFGRNDTFGSGVSTEVIIQAVDRQISKVQLDYVAASDLYNGAVAASTWTNVLAPQTFKVEYPQSIIDITVRGSGYAGQAAVNMVFQVRILIDSAVPYYLSGQHNESTSWYSNPFAGGGQTVKLQNLSVGNHTVLMQVHATSACSFLLRCASAATQEWLYVQVTEHAR